MTLKKMFITDLDGTLFTDEKKIHSLDLKSLEYLGKMGVIRVFATGRSIYSFQKAVENMGFLPSCEAMPVDYLIFSTGAGIIKLGEDNIIKKHTLEYNDIRYISNYFDFLKLDYMIHKPVPNSHYCIYKQQSESCYSDFTFRIKIYRDFIKKITSPDQIKEFGGATELMTIVPPEHGQEIAECIKNALSEFSVIRATSPLDGKSVWIEVFKSSVSKSQAVSWLANQLGILQSNVVAIGNDYNDMDMLDWVGKGFVVHNAPEEFKKKFRTVSSNNECGVSDVINSIIWNY